MPRKTAVKRTDTHEPHGMGRLAETAYNGPTLPDVPNYRVDAVREWLAEHRDVRHPLTVAAPLLALVCALYEKGEYMPTRVRLAAWLRDEGYASWTSKHPNAVDKVLNAALGLNEVELRWEVEAGKAREEGERSIVRRRYLAPNRELLSAYRRATRGSMTPAHNASSRSRSAAR